MKKMLSAKSFYTRAAVLTCLLSLVLWGQGFCQDHAITGRVTDRNGAPLQNVSVNIKGSPNGSVTDADGRFVVHSTQAKPVLVLSLVGYGTEQVTVSGGSVAVSLQQSYIGLDTVIVSLGYSNQRRRDVSASIGSVAGNEIKDLPATTVEEALQGRIAGVNVIVGSGQPGNSTAPTILIRGYNSVNNVNPLYIVDGVRSSGDNFNMDDIASIDVLKDASAAAIYGSAAEGGVIIITTKKGGHGRPVINLSARYGSVRPKIIHLLNRDRWVGLERLINPTFLSGVNAATLPNTDWVNELYGNGTDQRYNLSISGGNENANYLLSGFYAPQRGVFIDNSNYLTGVRINSDFRVNKAIRIGEEVYATATNNNPVNSAANPPFRTVPTQNVYDSTNQLGGGWGKDPSYYKGGNPVANELSNPQLNRSYQAQGNVYADVKLPLYLSFRATISYETDYSMNESFQEAYNYGNIVNPVNQLNKSSSLNTNVLANYVLHFDHAFGKHTINAFGGYEQQTGTTDGLNLNYTAQGLSPTFSIIPTSQSSLQSQPVGNYDPNKLIKSLFGQVSYNYDGRYYIQGSVRQDANYTKFGPSHQKGVFPSVSGSWRISEEKFFDFAARTINELKIRGSYGELGNDNIQSYYYDSYYNPSGLGNNFYPGGPTYIGLNQVALSNKDIHWESLHEVNIGLDASFIDKKLNLSMDWYNKKSLDVLYNVTLPPSTGFSSQYIANIGSIQNRGYEFTIGYHDKAGQVGYSVSFNGAFNNNKILSLDGTAIGKFANGSNNLGGGEGIANTNIALNEAGHSFGEFYGFKAAGIYQTAAQVAKNPQFAGQTAAPGDLIFADVNRSGSLTDSDRTFIGNPNPKFVYGATININWKGLDASLLFNGVAGVDIYNGVRAYEQFLFQDGNTDSRIFADSYLGNNGLTSQPRMGFLNSSTNTYNFDPNGNYTRINSYFVEKGGYLKLKVLQLGYSFSARSLQAVHINNARLYVEGTNIFTITKYTGQDPELAGGVTAHGIDAPNQYPHTRVYSVGVNLTF